MAEIIVNNQSKSQKVDNQSLLNLVDKTKINTSGTYETFIPIYKNLPKEVQKGIRKRFQNDFLVERSHLFNTNNNIDTDIIKAKSTKADFEKQTFKVADNVYLFKVQNEKNLLVCLDLSTVFSEPKQVQSKK